MRVFLAMQVALAAIIAVADPFHPLALILAAGSLLWLWYAAQDAPETFEPGRQRLAWVALAMAFVLVPFLQRWLAMQAMPIDGPVDGRMAAIADSIAAFGHVATWGSVTWLSTEWALHRGLTGARLWGSLLLTTGAAGYHFAITGALLPEYLTRGWGDFIDGTGLTGAVALALGALLMAVPDRRATK